MRFGNIPPGRLMLPNLPLMSEYHRPVLVNEVLAALRVVSGAKYIDATVGGGGHGIEIVRRGGVLLGIDVDREAIEHARIEFEIQCSELKEGRDWTLVQGNFRDIQGIAKEHGFAQVAGVLFDLGVSSHQLDTAGRGFSYRWQEAPLDLRLDQSQGLTAAELIKKLDENELYEILAKFGEEKLARPIAAAIGRARHLKEIKTTGDLREAIATVVKRSKEETGVLARVFQALRIAVNDEIEVLREGLEGAKKVLGRGGRLVVISFHSLEDRAVKQFMRSSTWKLINKKPIEASYGEIMVNPRARSAKLRIAEKL